MFKYINGKLTNHLPLDDLFNQIKEHISEVERKNEYLRQENEKLRDSAYKNEELKFMKEKLEQTRKDARRGFSITKEQERAINKWKKEHLETAHNGNEYSGAIGGRWSYTFVPTGIGTFGTIKCSCGEKFDFADDF